MFGKCKARKGYERLVARAASVSRRNVGKLSENADDTCVELAGSLGYIGGCQLGSAGIPPDGVKTVIQSLGLERRSSTVGQRYAVLAAYREAFATGYADRIDRANGVFQP